MANMSYCRFYNTRIDVSDCLDALRIEETLSKSEAKSAKWMLEDVADFFFDSGIVDEDEISHEVVAARIAEMIDTLMEREED